MFNDNMISKVDTGAWRFSIFRVRYRRQPRSLSWVVDDIWYLKSYFVLPIVQPDLENESFRGYRSCGRSSSRKICSIFCYKFLPVLCTNDVSGKLLVCLQSLTGSNYCFLIYVEYFRLGGACHHTVTVRPGLTRPLHSCLSLRSLSLVTTSFASSHWVRIFHLSLWFLCLQVWDSFSGER